MSFIDLVDGAAAPSEWQDVAVHVTRGEKGLSAASSRIVARGRELANQLGCYLKAFGRESCPEAARLGADRVFAGDPAVFVEREKPDILLFAEADGALAGQIAQRFRTGLEHAFEVDLDVTSRLLVMRSRLYGGRVIRERVCPKARPQIAVLETARLAEPQEDPARRADVIQL